MIKDLGNGKKSKAIMYTSQLFASTVQIPALRKSIIRYSYICKLYYKRFNIRIKRQRI